MTNWEKGRPARERRAAKLRVEMDELIARMEAGDNLGQEFHNLFQVARRYISFRDGLGSYYKRFMIAYTPFNPYLK